MFTTRFLTSWRSYCALVALSATMVATGCNNIPSHKVPTPAPDTPLFTKCPPYNPEQNICTAQYDPVCVTIKNGSVTRQQTAGNACSACGSALAVGYVKGECQ